MRIFSFCLQRHVQTGTGKKKMCWALLKTEEAWSSSLMLTFTFPRSEKPNTARNLQVPCICDNEKNPHMHGKDLELILALADY